MGFADAVAELELTRWPAHKPSESIYQGPRYVDRMPEMSGPEMEVYLRRIRLPHSVSDLLALAREVERAFPTDEATRPGSSR